MTATLQESRTVDPVSLAEIKARKFTVVGGRGPDRYGYVILVSPEERDAIVELAEAYLAVRDLKDERERGRAEARLALAAKGVRP